MKKLRGSLGAKIAAVVLLCALVLVCVLSVLGTAYLYDMGAYTLGYDNAAAQAIEKLGMSYCYGVGHNCLRGNTRPSYTNSNFLYTVTLPDGTELVSNYNGEATLWEGTAEVSPNVSVESFYYPYDGSAAVPTVTPSPQPTGSMTVVLPDGTEAAVVPTTPAPTAAPEARPAVVLFNNDTGEALRFPSLEESEQWRRDNSVTVHGYVLSGLPYTDEFSREVHLFTRLYAYRGALPGIAAASFVLGVLVFVFLLSAAGHRDAGDTITANFIDRIPLDLLAALLGFGILLLLMLLFDMTRTANLLSYIIMGLSLLGAGLLFLLFWMSFATRVKLGTVWQNSLIVKLWRGCVRLLRGLWQLFRHALRALPPLWRWVLLLAGLMLFELLLLMGAGRRGGARLWVFHLLVLCPAVLYLAWCLRTLRLGAKALAAGDLGYTVGTKYLPGSLREHADDLNHIRDGMNAAVEERMKSERFKSELITNVSHDIKTPLTSIVTYVDLLEKEQLENETAREYVAVLSRQAARLKKLIDDLVEASKASTGVLPVHAERCELGVLLDQCAGEYGERLKAAGLETVITKPDTPVSVLADGRHMWRIFDNLLGNIVKYAQPGTRVYLSLSEERGKAAVTFRNISREPLNLSGEALMERFVRGDSSRSTEGSGLGLAIARSLAQLQGGDMDVQVDGDLFKVILRFDTAETNRKEG